jgi:FAD-dependent urate hydroxylase
MSDKKPVLIIGGGIGGATAALALRKIGVEALVFERATELKEVGAGLGLWLNAVSVFDKLGIGEKIRSISQPLVYGDMCRPDGKTISSMKISDVIGSEDTGNFVMHRAALHNAILENLPKEILFTDHEFKRFEQIEDTVVAHFKNGAIFEGSLLIGADGLHSVVRREIAGETPLLYSGQTCFRGIADYVDESADTIREIQGRGIRGAVCPLNQEKVYWWTAMNAPAGEQDVPAERRERLLEIYKGWSFGLPGAIAATTGEILKNDLYDREPLTNWTRGRATLLGDAAHPTTPNLGQGACMAIEDGFVLARNIQKHGANEKALLAYQTERIPRTSKIVKQSRQFGRLAGWENPFAVWLRETILKLTPASATKKFVRGNVCFDAGQLTSG